MRSCLLRHLLTVSIHALLAECDRPNEFIIGFFKKFQSTHSLRSATGRAGEKKTLMRVSIHALLAECDTPTNRPQRGRGSFNPRTPCGVRHAKSGGHRGQPRFNPRTPCGVRLNTEEEVVEEYVFQSTHSLRSATQMREKRYYKDMFQSTHSLRSATS